MRYFLGVDTGGTYTDAVILDEGTSRVIGWAKALTTRSDLAVGIGGAIDAALSQAGVAASDIALVSLSTTLATNALVEGQGGRVALVFIGFTDSDFERAGLAEAVGNDPVIRLVGGHGHSGDELAPLDVAELERQVSRIGSEVEAFAVAAHFATRNTAHERMARDVIRRITGRPVTCSHELSAQLNGPRRALTAVLNARLVGMIDRLVSACERHLEDISVHVPMMVVRGDGALISAEIVRERPIETILSGPAASIVGARWLSGERNALVSDIGGTTTDVALLRDGLPEIDPQGARVGRYRTMVEAVAMRTFGLGGDSEVRLVPQGLRTEVRLGPRRRVPVSLLASQHPAMVHAALDRALSAEVAGEFDGVFVMPVPGLATGLPSRDAGLLERISRAMPLSEVVRTRLDLPALDRLVARGLVVVSGVTPSDASHALGLMDSWDASAAEKGLRLFARKRESSGERIATDAVAMAQLIVDRLTEQTVECLLETAFAEDAAFADEDPAPLARHRIVRAGLDGHRGVLEFTARLGVPLIGLGASAPNYYRAVGKRLGCPVVLPEHAGVANAIGAVVGQVSQRVSAEITSPGEGRFVAHLSDGPQSFGDRDEAFAAVEAALSDEAMGRARAAGAEHVRLIAERNLSEVEIEGKQVFINATVTVVASGRPRVAHA
ncbi:hydantoinase/oxoprolinase family protein [Ostreiculturibacter nitratireducens]|uniref:hydantoinase/oxoprolinase family protein n=1 Tax=Ostreiculturibacter nitratireducens TaxID=3075226 RepID=UPI0031B5843E